ncbi:MAG: alpha/beta fold hydrolase [Methanobrevibacter sp.]|nr:alpha/beta fold hydrolase [Methanobrevibacter sp.]
MKLNYVVEGKGEPLIFLHGLSDDLRYWEVLTSTLKKKYQVIRIDLRGHGESELGDDEITIDTYADDLKDLLDDLKIDAGNLIGFSLGGRCCNGFCNQISELCIFDCIDVNFCEMR